MNLLAYIDLVGRGLAWRGLARRGKGSKEHPWMVATVVRLRRHGLAGRGSAWRGMAGRGVARQGMARQGMDPWLA